MRARLIAAAASGAVLLTAPAAFAVEAAPLPRRDGVVVAWSAASKTAVIVTSNRRVYAVHALRRVAPGSRVRIEGIRWGTPAAGITWSVAPGGITWGIKLARNGTFESHATRLGTATTTSLRGTVVRRYGRRAVAVSVRGATFVVPLGRSAVWLPGGKVQNATAPLGRLGATVVIPLRFAAGRAVATRVTQIAPPVTGAPIALSGRVIAADAAARNLTVRAGTAAFPLDLVVALSPAFDPALYPVGSQVTGMAAPAPAPDTTLYATALSLNATFAQADSPTTSVTAPAPHPAHVAAARSLRDRWVAGRAGGLVPNNGLFSSNLNRLDRLGFLISVSDKSKAVKELDQLVKAIQNETPSSIDPAFGTEVSTAARALRDQLAAG